MVDISTNTNGIDKFGLYVENQKISFIRRNLIVCILLYSLFAGFDYILYPEYIKEFFIIRFGIVVPFMVLVYALSYTRPFRKIQEYLLILLNFLAGGGIVVMIYIIGGHNYYTNGLFLVFAIGFHLIRLKSHNSLIAFLLVVALYITLGFITKNTRIEQIVGNSLFFLIYGSIGVFGGFLSNRYVKSQKQYEKHMQEEKMILEERIKTQLYRINAQLEEINNVQVETIYSIAKLAESRDTLTGDHLMRVGNLSYILADSLSDEIYKKNNKDKQDFLESIKLSSILHDIGKVSISDEILNKPGKLTEEEFNIMKTHTNIGAETLKSIGGEALKNSFVVMGIEIAKYHHEKWDGTGYPTGKSGYDIPFSARLVAVIDVFDALISKRPYKEKFSKAKSLEIIKESSGKHFDPEIAETFIAIAKASDDELLFWK